MENENLEWSEVKKPHFFKVLLGNFKTSLRIPPRFVKNLATKIEGSNLTAFLEGPSGKIWQVNIEKNKDGIFFTTGWSKFVEDHKLKEYEFLVFKYNLNLHFSVLVFDLSACEKELGFSDHEERENSSRESEILMNKQERENKEKNEEIVLEREDEVKELNYEEIMKLAKDCESLATKKRPRDFDLSSFKFDKRKKCCVEETLYDIKMEIKKENANEFKTETPSPISNITIHKDGNNTNNNTPSSMENKLNADEEVEEIPISEMLKNTKVNPKCFDGEKLNAKEAALLFDSKFPYVVIHMTKYLACSSHYLRFPTKFSIENLPREKTSFVLHDPMGRKWGVIYVPHNGLRDVITSGWSAFKKGNSLKVDDYCVFELIKRNEFRVHIFRDGE